MPSAEIALHLPAAGATEMLGTVLAEELPELDAHGAVLHLHGELGAGKTTSVRALLRALGVTTLVRSPTYTLVETYQTAAVTCVHVDLYRLTDAGEVEGLGLRELHEPGTLMLIEWPEKGGLAIPPADVALRLTYQACQTAGALEHSREARVLAHSALGECWLEHLADDTRLTPYVHHIT